MEQGLEPAVAYVFDPAAVKAVVSRVQPEIVIEQLTALPRTYTRESLSAASSFNDRLRLEGGANVLAAAQSGDCTDALWLKLASLRSLRHLAEARVVYQRLIRHTFTRKDGFSAQQAFKLLLVARRLLQRLNRVEDFEEYQAELIERFGRQRTFRHWQKRAP